jgi:hypothetical protein
MTGRLRLVNVPERIKEAVPVGYRESRAAQYLGVGIHLFRQLVKSGRIVPRLLGKTRIYLREDLDGFLRGLPVDRDAQSPVNQDPRTPVDRDARTPHNGDARVPIDRGTKAPVNREARPPVRRDAHLPADRDGQFQGDRDARLPADRTDRLPVDLEAHKMPHQDPARLQRKEDYRGH